MSVNSRLARILDSPAMRAGHCCGCQLNQTVLLFKLPEIYRYRCALCYKKETGMEAPRIMLS